MLSIRSALCGLAIASSLALGATPAAAHDQWLEAEPFFAATPGREKVYLMMGERFAEAQPLVVKTRDKFSRFFIQSSAGRRDILPDVREDVQPILLLTSGKASGSFMIAADATPYTIELDAKKFSAYLLEERLVGVLAARVTAGAEDLPGRERYTRHLKALVQIGQKLDPFATQPVGQELEIVPESHPYGVAPGGQLVVKVLFKGKPLGGQAVTAVNRYRGEIQSKTWRTDASGRVAFTIPRPGDWMIRLVHMEPSEQKDVDWRSWWSNLTFALPEAGIPRGATPPATR
jgi:Domain of unknown function (DUF4198)